jgi:hypothetical protein
MTNSEIEKQATLFARQNARRQRSLEPEDAWHEWSAANHVSSPATRHVFESMFRSRSAPTRGREG